MNTGNIVHFLQRNDQFFRSLQEIIKENLDAESAMDDAKIHKNLMRELVSNYVRIEKKVSELLRNTLPDQVVEEIQNEGQYVVREFHVTILFSDFSGFTILAEQISGANLIGILHHLFSKFDEIITTHGGTKIKTIGDAYMAVFGAPEHLENHPSAAIQSGLAMQNVVRSFNHTVAKDNIPPFYMRVGIHTGPVMAGVVGRDRMQFDVFGDHVNIASRFESSGGKGRVNISEATYQHVHSMFACEERGFVKLKNKADMKAFFVDDKV